MRPAVRFSFGAALAAGAAVSLFPLWARAQGEPERARKAACMGNLKQLSLALTMYTEDYDQTYPPAHKWSSLVMPYVRSRDVFNCPSAGMWGYGMNMNLDGANVRRVSSPALTTLLFEAKMQRPNTAGLAVDTVPDRHLGGSNYAYVDGHVKWSRTAPPFGPVAPKRRR